MYTDRNFKTKKELKEAVKLYNERVAAFAASPKTIRNPDFIAVRYYQPGPFGGNEPKNGTFYCEGPHYPEPHRWYATCTAKDGVIISVK